MYLILLYHCHFLLDLTAINIHFVQIPVALYSVIYGLHRNGSAIGRFPVDRAGCIFVSVLSDGLREHIPEGHEEKTPNDHTVNHFVNVRFVWILRSIEYCFHR